MVLTDNSSGHETRLLLRRFSVGQLISVGRTLLQGGGRCNKVNHLLALPQQGLPVGWPTALAPAARGSQHRLKPLQSQQAERQLQVRVRRDRQACPGTRRGTGMQRWQGIVLPQLRLPDLRRPGCWAAGLG